MKIVFATSGQLRHRYCLQQLVQTFPDYEWTVIIERKQFPWMKRFKQYASQSYNPIKSLLLNPYLHIPYREKEIDSFEQARWGYLSLPLSVPWYSCASINEQWVKQRMEEIKPDLLISYGTSRIEPGIYSLAKRTVNAHGGWLPDYRGMDTNLHAIWNSDWSHVGVTLHELGATLDTGDILARERIYRPFTFVNLRSQVAELATFMLSKYLSPRWDYPIIQQGEGKYYRPMPPLLKVLTDIKISNHQFVTLERMA